MPEPCTKSWFFILRITVFGIQKHQLGSLGVTDQGASAAIYQINRPFVEDPPLFDDQGGGLVYVGDRKSTKPTRCTRVLGVSLDMRNSSNTLTIVFNHRVIPGCLKSPAEKLSIKIFGSGNIVREQVIPNKLPWVIYPSGRIAYRHKHKVGSFVPHCATGEQKLDQSQSQDDAVPEAG